MTFLQESKHDRCYDPALLLTRILSRAVHIHVQGRLVEAMLTAALVIIFPNWKQISIHRSVDRQIEVYLRKGTVLISKA